MAKPGEWSAKGATLSDATALKEYGVKLDFIVTGIRSGQLEYRESSIWGNPILRVVRSQLEEYILTQLGQDYLETQKAQTELQKIKSEMTTLTKTLTQLKARRLILETFIATKEKVKNDTIT